MGVFDVIGDTILYCLALEMPLGGCRLKGVRKVCYYKGFLYSLLVT